MGPPLEKARVFTLLYLTETGTSCLGAIKSPPTTKSLPGYRQTSGSFGVKSRVCGSWLKKYSETTFIGFPAGSSNGLPKRSKIGLEKVAEAYIKLIPNFPYLAITASLLG